MLKPALALMLLLLLPVCSIGQGAADTEPYAVYSAVVNERFGERQNQLFAISSTTLDLYNHGLMVVRFPDVQRFALLSQEVFDDFRAKNKQPQPLSDNFDLKIKYVFGGNGKGDLKQWDRVGRIGLSSVGFNSQKDQALVYLTYSYGGRGERFYALLIKEGENWKVRKRLAVWK